MGCDIHMVLEKRYDGSWIGLHAFQRMTVLTSQLPGDNEPLRYSNMYWDATARNYSLFAALASVRGESPVGNDPRGLPDDISALAEMEVESYGDDGHSHTHMLLSEAATIFMTFHRPTYLLTNERHDVAAGLFGIYIDKPEDFDEYRLIIWFDN